jgi:tetratricopeptide (TPR) repeat protein
MTTRTRAGQMLGGVILIAALTACGSSSKTARVSPGATDAASPSELLSKALREHVAGDSAQAKKDYEAVIEKDPRNKFAFYNLGLIAQRENRASDAENQYRLALTIDSAYEPALYNLAILRANAGDTSGAIDLYRRAIAANAKDASAHFNLGLLLRRTSQIIDGDAEIRAAVKLDPSLGGKAHAQGVSLPAG